MWLLTKELKAHDADHSLFHLSLSNFDSIRIVNGSSYLNVLEQAYDKRYKVGQFNIRA